MSAQIQFLAGLNNNTINNLSGSGLGFYGAAGFGYSIPIGGYNGRTFITDSTGTQQGPEIENALYLTNSTVILGQAGSGINLLAVPNYLATLNLCFTNDSPVLVQNVTLYGYDRVSTSNAPSGVWLYAAEIVHPGLVQTVSGSGSTTWTNLGSGGQTITLTSSPGMSGLRPSGSASADSRHDWYTVLSATPQTVGAKTFGLFCSLEFL